jgi:protein SCO1/2
VVSAARFKGRKVILNFIYTRCPVASMCPASTAKMMALQAAVKKAGIPNVELVSITLDPEYDTPSVLKSYAKVRSIDTSNFTFLTGPEGEVRNLLLSFGVLAEKKDNLLKHTLATVLIDETGVIRYRAEGSGWTSEEFMTALTGPLERK